MSDESNDRVDDALRLVRGRVADVRAALRDMREARAELVAMIPEAPSLAGRLQSAMATADEGIAYAESFLAGRPLTEDPDARPQMIAFTLDATPGAPAFSLDKEQAVHLAGRLCVLVGELARTPTFHTATIWLGAYGDPCLWAEMTRTPTRDEMRAEISRRRLEEMK